MKNFLLAFILLFSLQGFAQDSTVVKNISLQARLIEYLVPHMINPVNDSLFQTYLDLRPKFRVVTPPTGTQNVLIDSIPTVELAQLYNIVLYGNDGLQVGQLFKSQLTTPRANNSYLDRLCSAYEQTFIDRLIMVRINGRRILRGK